MNVFEIIGRVGLNTDDVDKGRAQVESKLQSFGDGLTSLGQKMTLGITAPLALLGAGMSSAASDAEENLSKFEVVFGNLAGQVATDLGTFAAAANRSKTEMIGMSASVGDLLQPLGYTREEAAKMSVDIVKLATDLGSFNNMSTDEALQRLTGTMIGSHENALKFGVVINENTLKADLAARGVDNLTGAELEREKVQSRINLLLAGTTAAQGDAIRTADSFSNQIRGMSGALGEAALPFGRIINDALLPLIGVVKDVSLWFTTLDEDTQKFIVALGGVAAAAGPVAVGLGAVMKLFSEGGPAALSKILSPANLTVAAFLAIGAAVAAVIIYWDDIKAWAEGVFPGIGEKIDTVVGGISDAFGKIMEAVSPIVEDLRRTFSRAYEAVADVLGTIIDAVAGMISEVASVFGDGKDEIGDVISAVGTVISGIWDATLGNVLDLTMVIFEHIAGTIKAAFQIVGGIWDTFKALFTGDWEGVWNGIKATLVGVWSLIVQGVETAINAIIALIPDFARKWLGIPESIELSAGRSVEALKGMAAQTVTTQETAGSLADEMAGVSTALGDAAGAADTNAGAVNRAGDAADSTAGKTRKLTDAEKEAQKAAEDRLKHLESAVEGAIDLREKEALAIEEAYLEMDDAMLEDLAETTEGIDAEWAKLEPLALSRAYTIESEWSKAATAISTSWEKAYGSEGGMLAGMNAVLATLNGPNGLSAGISGLTSLLGGSDGLGAGINAIVGVMTGQGGMSSAASTLTSLLGGNDGLAASIGGITGMLTGEGSMMGGISAIANIAMPGLGTAIMGVSTLLGAFGIDVDKIMKDVGKAVGDAAVFIGEQIGKVATAYVEGLGMMASAVTDFLGLTGGEDATDKANRESDERAAIFNYIPEVFKAGKGYSSLGYISTGAILQAIKDAGLDAGLSDDKLRQMIETATNGMSGREQMAGTFQALLDRATEQGFEGDRIWMETEMGKFADYLASKGVFTNREASGAYAEQLISGVYGAKVTYMYDEDGNVIGENGVVYEWWRKQQQEMAGGGGPAEGTQEYFDQYVWNDAEGAPSYDQQLEDYLNAWAEQQAAREAEQHRMDVLESGAGLVYDVDELFALFSDGIGTLREDFNQADDITNHVFDLLQMLESAGITTASDDLMEVADTFQHLSEQVMAGRQIDPRQMEALFAEWTEARNIYDDMYALAAPAGGTVTVNVGLNVDGQVLANVVLANIPLVPGI